MASSSAVKTLVTENSSNIFLQTSDVLIRVANNVIKQPENERYRKLKIINPLVQEKLMPITGALETLFEMGFVDSEDGESFVLPQSAPLVKLQNIRDQLLSERVKVSGLTPAPAPQPPLASSVFQPPSFGGATARSSTSAAQGQHRMLSQVNFLRKLENSLSHVLQYENRSLQEKARTVIPVVRLETQAKQKHDEILQQDKDSKGVGYRDLLLLELLAWFKDEFFQWVDAPPCEHCGEQTQGAEGVMPNDEEQLNGASKVENYKCNGCLRYTRFPRYNNPGRLLETHRGRCGEWANCFTLCCIAMGFEARYVLDWTDHVWTEVWSDAQNRWLHVDPCEKACDKPLIYESGWGKKLSYIIAFSRDDVQDVTWRYSCKHKEVISRRNECDEIWLVKTLIRLRKGKQMALGPARKKALEQRLVRELVELSMERQAGDGEGVGRQSGSLAWRLMRGETGATTFTPVTITPNPEEITAKLLHLQYNCATDTYHRPSAAGATVKGWQQMVHETKDVFRKEERDWKMCYLARHEGTDAASVTWKFDFTDSHCVIDNVMIKALSSRFESGQVVWRVCSDQQCVFLPPDGSETTLDSFGGSTHLSVTAHLRGGKGDTAWQHTQLFRQPANDSDFPFEVQIKLKPE